MFGLSMLQERLILLGVLVIVIFGFAWHERHIGAQKCLQNVEKASAIEAGKQATQYTADQGTVSNEGKTYEAAKTAPIAPAPVVRLCPRLPRQAVQGAAVPGPKADAEVPSGKGDSGQSTLWDSTPVVKAGR